MFIPIKEVGIRHAISQLGHGSCNSAHVVNQMVDYLTNSTSFSQLLGHLRDYCVSSIPLTTIADWGTTHYLLHWPLLELRTNLTKLLNLTLKKVEIIFCKEILQYIEILRVNYRV